MSEHRGVPAAEKYAELLANGQERPRCACHGETMYWNKNRRLPAGGWWRCVVIRAEFAKSEKGKQRHREYYKKNRDHLLAVGRQRRLDNLAEHKERERRYRKTDKRREALSRYVNSEKGVQTRKNGAKLRVCMFGIRLVAPDMQFREYAVQLREERRRALKEASNG